MFHILILHMGRDSFHFGSRGDATCTVGQMDGVWLWPAGLLLCSVDSRLLFRRRRALLTGSLCLSSASLLSPVTWSQDS